MNEQDFETTEMMLKIGGGFVQQLAMLARKADTENLQKIKETWAAYGGEYEQLAKIQK